MRPSRLGTYSTRIFIGREYIIIIFVTIIYRLFRMSTVFLIFFSRKFLNCTSLIIMAYIYENIRETKQRQKNGEIRKNWVRGEYRYNIIIIGYSRYQSHECIGYLIPNNGSNLDSSAGVQAL